MVSALGEGIHLTHLGTVEEDYRQRQKTSGFQWMFQKTESDKPLENWVSANLGKVSPNLVVKATCLADP